MFRLAAKWGGTLVKVVPLVEYRAGVSSSVAVVLKSAVSSSPTEMPWHLRSLHTTANVHKSALPTSIDSTQPAVQGVAEHLKKMFALNHPKGAEFMREIALDRLQNLATTDRIADSNKAWFEVYACLQLVNDLPQYIQYSLLSSALDRRDDNAVISTLKFLLDCGLDINAQDIGGNSVLYLAAIDSSKEVIDFLLDNKANALAKTITGETILDVAARRLVHGDEDAVLQIISNLAHAGDFTEDELQVVYDTIIGTGVTNSEQVGVDIMGDDMWRLCEEGDTSDIT